jgi:ketosteroid isomerase-like protein
MPSANEALIARFYAALDAHDGEAMAANYTADAHFSDPVFTDLNGAEPGAMWRMLTSRSEDLSVVADEIEADDARGSAHWVATYTFRTGRKVVNDIRASFVFRNGQIAEHTDVFDFGKWAKQAIGGPALVPVIGPALMQPIVRRQAAGQLREFIAQQPAE